MISEVCHFGPEPSPFLGSGSSGATGGARSRSSGGGIGVGAEQGIGLLGELGGLSPQLLRGELEEERHTGERVEAELQIGFKLQEVPWKPLVPVIREGHVLPGWSQEEVLLAHGIETNFVWFLSLGDGMLLPPLVVESLLLTVPPVVLALQHKHWVAVIPGVEDMLLALGYSELIFFCLSWWGCPWLHDLGVCDDPDDHRDQEGAADHKQSAPATQAQIHEECGLASEPPLTPGSCNHRQRHAPQVVHPIVNDVGRVVALLAEAQVHKPEPAVVEDAPANHVSHQEVCVGGQHEEKRRTERRDGDEVRVVTDLHLHGLQHALCAPEREEVNVVGSPRDDRPQRPQQWTRQCSPDIDHLRKEVVQNPWPGTGHNYCHDVSDEKETGHHHHVDFLCDLVLKTQHLEAADVGQGLDGVRVLRGAVGLAIDEHDGDAQIDSSCQDVHQ
mmetsp:Transcript_48020/g.102887  ORF Transcript_48020/g.102887 Transcript_48020/m.102887 type:complete len:444 (-) Transcript_48020:2231-3562(-)